MINTEKHDMERRIRQVQKKIKDGKFAKEERQSRIDVLRARAADEMAKAAKVQKDWDDRTQNMLLTGDGTSYKLIDVRMIQAANVIDQNTKYQRESQISQQKRDLEELKHKRLKEAIQLLNFQADEGKLKKIAEKSAAMEVNISTLSNFRDAAQKELDDYVAKWRSETDAAKNKLELIKRFSPDDTCESRAYTLGSELPVDPTNSDINLRLTAES
jgi:hypothetical protein